MENPRKLFNFFSSETEEGRLRKMLLLPLSLLSFFYGLLIQARVYFYRLGIFRSCSLSCKVISVGNITLGGTGKTPLVVWLAEWMQAQKIPVAILSRGYKGSFAGRHGIVSDGQSILMDARQAGDEPYLLSKKLKGIPVLIGRDRRLSGQEAIEKFRARAVILDDGFQHLPLKRDVNLLLVDSRTPFGNGRLFPRGRLREPLREAARADALILTKADLSDNIKKLKDKLLKWAPGRPVFAVRYAPVGVWDQLRECALPLETLRGKNIFAFTGIGSPASFRRSLENLGGQVVGFSSFPDHYWYRRENLRELLKEAEEKSAEALITTEKDSVRLEGFPPGKIPLWVLSVRHEFIGSERELFENFLWKKLELGKKG